MSRSKEMVQNSILAKGASYKPKVGFSYILSVKIKHCKYFEYCKTLKILKVIYSGGAKHSMESGVVGEPGSFLPSNDDHCDGMVIMTDGDQCVFKPHMRI